MTDRLVTHATFVIERTYAASPARVFAAWAEGAFLDGLDARDQPAASTDQLRAFFSE